MIERRPLARACHMIMILLSRGSTCGMRSLRIKGSGTRRLRSLVYWLRPVLHRCKILSMRMPPSHAVLRLIRRLTPIHNLRRSVRIRSACTGSAMMGCSHTIGEALYYVMVSKKESAKIQTRMVRAGAHLHHVINVPGAYRQCTGHRSVPLPVPSSLGPTTAKAVVKELGNASEARVLARIWMGIQGHRK